MIPAHPEDTCLCCDQPMVEVHTCYLCLRSVHPGCGYEDEAGDLLCPECYGAMRAFVADAEEVA